jgi:hypothetical protein
MTQVPEEGRGRKRKEEEERGRKRKHILVKSWRVEARCCAKGV